MNLTKIDGCYSKELRENCHNIKLCVKTPSIDLKEMKRLINCMIEPAFIEAEAKARFKENLDNCETKQEVDDLCKEVVIHGMYYKPHKRK